MKSCKIIILLFVLSCWMISTAFAAASSLDPSEIGVGARPLGLGKAFAAIADDPNAIFMNPAGLALIPNFQISTMHSSVLNIIDYVTVSGLYPTEYGIFGFGYAGSTADGSPVTQRNPITNQIEEAGGEMSAYNNVLILSYGTELSRWIESDYVNNISVGTNLKLFNKGVVGAGLGGTGNGFDLDIGVIYKPFPFWSLAWNQQNALPYTMGGRVVWESGATESIPSTTKLGTALKLLSKRNGLYSFMNQEVQIALDADISPTQNIPMLMHYGVEWSPLNFFSIRMGIDQSPASSVTLYGNAGSPTVVSNFTSGVSLFANGFQIDYAYHQYKSTEWNMEFNNTSYVSFSFVGQTHHDFVTFDKDNNGVTPVIKKEIIKLNDVRENYWARAAILKIVNLGYLSVDKAGNFFPENNITRAQMAKLICDIKDYKLPLLKNDVYTDVPANHAYASYIAALKDSKILSRNNSSMFKPNDPVTRGQFIKVMVEISGHLKEGSVPYSDVSKRSWLYPYVAKAHQAGLLSLFKESKLYPDKYVSRAEMAELLLKLPEVEKKLTSLQEKEIKGGH